MNERTNERINQSIQQQKMAHLNSKNKQYDLPVRRTLNGGKGKGGKGKGGTCSKNEANNCIGRFACAFDDTNSVHEKTGVCIGDYSCKYMKFMKVDEFGCSKLSACRLAEYADICKSSCRGDNACKNMKGTETNRLIVNPGACGGSEACQNLENVSEIGSGACQRQKACFDFNGSAAPDVTIGTNSCVGERSCREYTGGSIGNDSCIGEHVCRGYTGPSIGENACVDPSDQICKDCSSPVGDNECNVNMPSEDCPCSD